MKKLLPKTVPKVHEKVISLIDITSGKVLDVGCGRGGLLQSIKKIFPALTSYGCDIDEKSLEFKDIKFKKSDINKGLDYKKDSFDLIFCIEVIEHVENPFFLIRELNRVLKKQGTLIITSPNVENIFSKILFLFTGRFIHFFKITDFYKTGHINPIFSWKWGIMLNKHFKFNKIVYNRGNIPIFNIPIPTNRLTGEIRILKLKKK